MIKNFKWLLFASLALVACDSEEEVTIDANSSDGKSLTSGTASVSKYVALGDSYAAGFSDNALFIAAQQGSYANIISQQFALIGGGEFKTPLMADNVGGLLLGGNVIQGQRLFFNGTAPTPVTGIPSTEVTTKLTGSFNNMGVPGAKSYHLVAPGYGNVAGVATGQANPYFARFSSSASTTVLADAVAQAPTFFSLWIGGNDVLGYATSGGSGVNRTGNLNPATYSSNDITDPNVFASAFSGIVNAMTANGAKGVVANLPYVTALPYFTTVPYNPVALSAAAAAQLNAGYAAYNGGLQAMVNANLLTATEATRRTINFKAGANAVVIVDSYLTDRTSFGIPSFRHATAEDLVVLPARSFIGTVVGGNAAAVNGVSVPLADSWVLSKEEIAEVKVATDAYNVTIKSIADAKGLAFVELKSVTDQLANGGIVYNGYTTTSTYVTGGMFSLDGVHPSPRGYAIIANLFTEAINAKFGANFKNKNVGLYRILYPATL
ncbi:SGNH/GDSL hydrolase family protein [Flavobacterium yafengii]|uniref:SGNH/GDSL hydrolase family protein n=1 Tax=Flavobacterium yafengii TaxID=3041253 RepID=UPI0024A81E19|nr:SGNH/GDSL hydrolase family protein [Flavobacterium yafengii]MDI5889118.1 SGNH/GDSL hydrolase family protein [Flavobacterium yafengii]